MTHLVPVSDDETLGTFFDYLWDAEEGFVYIAYKVSGNQHSFKQEFFNWPAQREPLIQFVLEKRAKFEVYHAPSLFKDASSAGKENVRGASVVWCEFDGNAPGSVSESSSHAELVSKIPNSSIPKPTLRVQSSLEGHEHWYWKLESFVDAEQLDRINRSITYTLGADTSGWDANQILRPPSTFNHKRERPVTVLEHFTGRLDVRLFDGLPPPPPLVTIPLPDKLPPIEEVVFRHKFPEHVIRLFKVGVPIGKRSVAMMSLGYYLAELQLTDNEVLAMLLNADKRWGKFDGRQDQLVRLAEIVTIARQKYPYTGTSDEMLPRLQPMGLLTLLRTDVHIEWVWNGILQTKGYMCLTGPSGIGKTQLALDVGGQIALGKPALDRATSAMKIGFFSLEMNLVELKEFLVLMAAAFTPEEQEMLEENFQFFPLGEPLYLNRPEEQEQVEQAIKDYGLQGIIIDSLGSATSNSLSDQVATKPLLDWNDRLRQRMGVFTWFIHHHRKASGDNKKPKKLDDVYGDMYIVGRASSAIALWDSGIPNTLDFIPLKIRLTQNPGKFHIKRGADLHFTRMVGGVVKEQEVEEEEEEDEEELESIELVIPSKTDLGI